MSRARRSQTARPHRDWPPRDGREIEMVAKLPRDRDDREIAARGGQSPPTCPPPARPPSNKAPSQLGPPPTEPQPAPPLPRAPPRPGEFAQLVYYNACPAEGDKSCAFYKRHSDYIDGDRHRVQGPQHACRSTARTPAAAPPSHHPPSHIRRPPRYPLAAVRPPTARPALAPSTAAVCRCLAGVRIFTLFMYLNDVPEGGGGGTRFTDLKPEPITFMPSRGKAVLWPSARYSRDVAEI